MPIDHLLTIQYRLHNRSRARRLNYAQSGVLAQISDSTDDSEVKTYALSECSPQSLAWQDRFDPEIDLVLRALNR